MVQPRILIHFVVNQVEFKDDRFSGLGIFSWANGDKYFGEFRQGRLNGYGTFTSANGRVFSGKFKDDQPIE